MRWPDGTREGQKRHALNHAESVYYIIELCEHRRTAVQAGGNVGFWPMRMAPTFRRVITFEPEPITFSCLVDNLGKYHNVEVRPEALGQQAGFCGIERRSLGSHRIISDGYGIKIMAVDHLGIHDLDLLQLDIEGYELKALRGAANTIRLCRPMIQIEMRDFNGEYGDSTDDIHAFFLGHGYEVLCQRPGADVIFVPKEKRARTDALLNHR